MKTSWFAVGCVAWAMSGCVGLPGPLDEEPLEKDELPPEESTNDFEHEAPPPPEEPPEEYQCVLPLWDPPIDQHPSEGACSDVYVDDDGLQIAMPEARPRSGCQQTFPPAAMNPSCGIEERPGPVYYVSATAGSDDNEGSTPDTAWASLRTAISRAADGATIRVAEGAYLDSTVHIGRGLIVKGGFDTSFASWDPDAHPTVFPGRLVLNHDDAVFGGFQMIAAPRAHGEADWSTAYHRIAAGSLVGNYVEIDFQGDESTYYFYAILASSCAGSRSRIACNDIYVQGTKPESGYPGDTVLVEAIEYGNVALHTGDAVVERNRVCLDRADWRSSIVAGYGSCTPGEPARVTLANNVLELSGDASSWASTGVSFYGCGEDDLEVNLAHNTIAGAVYGVSGYESDSGEGLIRWNLYNNVLSGEGGTAVDIGSGRTELASSYGNLSFGYESNAFSPSATSSEADQHGGATAESVFADGAYRPSASGAAAGTAASLDGVSLPVDLSVDLEGHARPQAGADRGAYQR